MSRSFLRPTTRNDVAATPANKIQLVPHLLYRLPLNGQKYSVKGCGSKYIRLHESMNRVAWLKADESERETFVCRSSVGRSKSGCSTVTRIDNKRRSHDHRAQIKSENVLL